MADMVKHLPLQPTIALLCGCLLLPSLAVAQGLSMSATLELSQIYRKDRWHPVRLEFRNDTNRAIDGTAVLSLNHPDAPAVMQLPLSVPASSRTVATIWGYFPSPSLAARDREGGQVPALSLAEWRGRDGARLARAELLGIPLSGLDDEYHPSAGGIVLLVDQREEMSLEQAESYDLTALMAHLNQAKQVPLVVASVQLEALSREPSALRWLKAIFFEAVDPESLDTAQRQALMQYVHGGGVVVFSAPPASAGRGGSWLGPYFPARVIGQRLARQIATSEAATLRFHRPVPIVEALESPGAQVLVRDEHFVHVAVQPLGLGKIVFTSFPLNALEQSSAPGEAADASAVLWDQLLELGHPQWEWEQTPLGEVRHAVLGAMIGRKVAPWATAAAVAAGYLVLILAVQMLFVGAARPRAFALSLAAAVGLAVIFLVMGMTRRADQVLQQARLSVIDIAPDGGGWQRDTFALIGSADSSMDLLAADERVMLRPALSDARNPPAVRQQPFLVDEMQVHSERIERVWEAASPAPHELRLDVIGRFGPGGLSLEVDNGLDQPLQSPMVLWQRRALATDALPAGVAQVSRLRATARGDYSSASVVASDLDKRRAQIVQASLPTGSEWVAGESQDVPQFVAWLDHPIGQGLARLSGQQPAEQKELVMVRAPLRIEPPQPGTQLLIPEALVKIEPGRMPFDLQRSETVPSQQEGQWLVGFAAPAQVGQVRPTRMTLDLRVTLPAHSLVLRRQQCRSGQAAVNHDGTVVAEWGAAVAQRQAVIDCEQGDFDEDGRVWLLLTVQSQDGAGGMQSPPWQIEDLRATLNAEAVAPPKALALNAAAENAPQRTNPQ